MSIKTRRAYITACKQELAKQRKRAQALALRPSAQPQKGADICNRYRYMLKAKVDQIVMTAKAVNTNNDADNGDLQGEEEEDEESY